MANYWVYPSRRGFEKKNAYELENLFDCTQKSKCKIWLLFKNMKNGNYSYKQNKNNKGKLNHLGSSAIFIV